LYAPVFNLIPALIFFQSSGGSSSFGVINILMLVFVFGIMYFILILPQQRRQKKWQQLLTELKTGDRVVTSGGIKGTIISIKDDSLHLRVPPDNLRLEITKSAVLSVITGDEK
jgi:preprotein translocase subunit YajC